MEYKDYKQYENKVCRVKLKDTIYDNERWTFSSLYFVKKVEINEPRVSDVIKRVSKINVLLELINPTNITYYNSMVLAEDIVEIKKLSKKEDLLFRLEHNL
jgi:hypothetical protein